MNKQVDNIKKIIGTRAVVVYILVFFIGISIVAQIINLMVFQREKWEKENAQSSTKQIIEAHRGNILARDKSLLATSVPWYRLTIDMRMPAWEAYFKYPNDSMRKELYNLAKGIAKHSKGKSTESIINELKYRYKTKSQFYFNNRYNFIEYKEISELPILKLGRLKSGLISEQNSRRVKPYKDLAFRTIGQMDHKSRGNAGLEMAYNQYLAGTQGEAISQRLPGNILMPIDNGTTIEPVDGYDLVTTIDVKFQDIVQHALMNKLQSTKADHGCAVLMEVETGEVLAISNLTDTLGDYLEYYNYAVGERTEPGSTMKLASLMAGIEDGYIKLTDSVNTGKGLFKYKSLNITDTEEEGYGMLTVKEAFKVSSNIGIVKTILKHYENRQKEFIDRLYNMNLNKKLGVDIPGEPDPIIKYPDDSLWWAGSLAQISYGYEVKFTPLQILAFYNAVANNGRMVRPRFAKRLERDGFVIQRFKTEVIDNSICSRSTVKKAKELLESVVDDGYFKNEQGKVEYAGIRGTAHNLERQHYKIAGKTGTAQIATDATGYGQKGKKQYQAPFVGYFPADNPKYSCIVVINSPKVGGYYGNVIAGSVFLEISDKIIAQNQILPEEEPDSKLIASTPYSKNGFMPDIAEVIDELDIPADKNDISSDWVITINKDSVIQIKNRIIKDDKLIPNVKGMGLKDALYILENKGLNVNITGYGVVKEQWPNPNSPFRKGDMIKLVLR